MKHILPIIAILISLSAFSDIEVRRLSNAYYYHQMHDEPYDYIGVMLKIDIKGNSQYIKNITEELKSLSQSANADMQYDEGLFHIEYHFHTSADYSQLMLSNIIEVLTGRDVDAAHFNRIMTDAEVPGELHIAVKSSLGPVHFLPIVESVKGRKLQIEYHALTGNYNGPEDMYHYDITQKDRYALPEIIMLDSDSRLNVIWLPGRFVIITPDSITEPGRDAFESLKQSAVDRMEISAGDLEFLFRHYPYIVLSNNITGINGITERIRRIREPAFTQFISGLKPSFRLKTGLNAGNIPQTETAKLSNGMTLIYMSSEGPRTEISVMIDNIRSNEQYYSKEYAGVLIMEQLGEYIEGWKYWNVPTLSDYRIFSTRTRDIHAGSVLESFLEKCNTFMPGQFTQSDLRVIISEQRQLRELLPFFESDNSMDALYLTEGEKNILKDKIIIPENITVAVKTSISIDTIAGLLEQTMEPVRESSPEPARYSTLEIKSNIDFTSNSNIESMPAILRGFFIYPSKVLIMRDISVISSDMLLTGSQYSRYVYSGIADNYALSVLMLLSHFTDIPFSRLFDTYTIR
ncbi:MAG: hypothetical protein SVK54_05430 [candidate division WOR-3 bacterium]|nr:hypothetical protein [candidate division WOR-3 bacterium]